MAPGRGSINGNQDAVGETDKGLSGRGGIVSRAYRRNVQGVCIWRMVNPSVGHIIMAGDTRQQNKI